MEEKKYFGKTCPQCGELCQTKEIAKIALGPGVTINMICEAGHRWSEYYSLDYRGYYYNGKKYNIEGEPEVN